MKDELGVIHDITNSIGIIHTARELMVADFPHLAGHPNMEMMTNHVTRCIDLLNKLRDLVIYQEASYKIKPMRLAEVFARLSSPSYPIAVVHKNKTHPDTMVHAHLNLIERVIDNCVHNGVKAGATRVIIEASEYDHLIEFQVKDNGHGMTEEQLKQLGFGYSASNTHGIGSRVLLDLIMQAGGTVNWQSIQEIGTVVTIRLRKYHEGESKYMPGATMESHHEEVATH